MLIFIMIILSIILLFIYCSLKIASDCDDLLYIKEDKNND